MTNQSRTPALTSASRDLFIALADAAMDWSGEPIFEGNDSERGNLTHLKKLGLVTSFVDGDCPFVSFTEAGQAYAAELGIDLGIILHGPQA